KNSVHNSHHPTQDRNREDQCWYNSGELYVSQSRCWIARRFSSSSLVWDDGSYVQSFVGINHSTTKDTKVILCSTRMVYYIPAAQSDKFLRSKDYPLPSAPYTVPDKVHLSSYHGVSECEAGLERMF